MKRVFQFTLIASALLVSQSLFAVVSSEQLAIKAAQLTGTPRVTENAAYSLSSYSLSNVVLDYAFELPVEAWTNGVDETIDYQFNEALGTVTIAITNENGMVVSRQIVNTNILASGSVSLANLAAGKYTVKFTTSTRAIYYAEFSIE